MWPGASRSSTTSSGTWPSRPMGEPTAHSRSSRPGTPTSRTTCPTTASTTAVGSWPCGWTSRARGAAPVPTYVLRRVLIAVPSLLIASLIVFTVPRLSPGDVVQLMLEEKAYGTDLDDLRAKLGLNRPIPVQYVEWLGRIARGDLGESLWTRQPVVEELARRLPVTLTLGFLAIGVAILVGIPIGVLAAVRQDGVLDFFFRSLAILGLSIPGFVLAIAIILLPAIWWGWTPLVRFSELSRDPLRHVAQFILPAVILGVAAAAGIMRLTRGMLLEVIRQDYVR